MLHHRNNSDNRVVFKMERLVKTSSEIKDWKDDLHVPKKKNCTSKEDFSSSEDVLLNICEVCGEVFDHCEHVDPTTKKRQQHPATLSTSHPGQYNPRLIAYVRHLHSNMAAVDDIPTYILIIVTRKGHDAIMVTSRTVHIASGMCLFIESKFLPETPVYKTPCGVYVLRLQHGRYYVGSSKNLWRRLWQHVRGTGARCTKLYCPMELMSFVPCDKDYLLMMEKEVYDNVVQIYGSVYVRGADHCSTRGF